MLVSATQVIYRRFQDLLNQNIFVHFVNLGCFKLHNFCNSVFQNISSIK